MTNPLFSQRASKLFDDDYEQEHQRQSRLESLRVAFLRKDYSSLEGLWEADYQEVAQDYALAKLTEIAELGLLDFVSSVEFKRRFINAIANTPYSSDIIYQAWPFDVAASLCLARAISGETRTFPNIVPPWQFIVLAIKTMQNIEPKDQKEKDAYTELVYAIKYHLELHYRYDRYPELGWPRESVWDDPQLLRKKLERTRSLQSLRFDNISIGSLAQMPIEATSTVEECLEKAKRFFASKMRTNLLTRLSCLEYQPDQQILKEVPNEFRSITLGKQDQMIDHFKLGKTFADQLDDSLDYDEAFANALSASWIDAF